MAAPAEHEDAGPLCALFALAWPLTLMYHFNAFIQVNNATSIAVVIASVALFFSRGKPIAWLLVAVAQISDFWWRLPLVGGSEYYTACIHVGVLLAWALAAWRRKSFSVERVELFEAMQPILRPMVIFLFGAAVLHKMNADFVDPTTSWSGHFYRSLSTFFGLPMVPWLERTAPTVTLLMESTPFIAFLIPRTRAIGVLVVYVLFLMIAIYGIAQFAALAYASTILFLEPRAVDKLLLRTRAADRAYPLPRLWIGVGTAVFLGAVIAVPPVPWVVSWIVIFVGTSGYFVFRAWRTATPIGSRSTLRPALIALPLFLGMFLNDASIYFGYKDWPTIRMYSNLQVDSCGTNHFFVPSARELPADPIVTTAQTWAALDGLTTLAHDRWTREWVFMETSRHARSVWEPSSFVEAVAAFARVNRVSPDRVQVRYEHRGQQIVEDLPALERRFPRSLFGRFTTLRPEPDVDCAARPEAL